jgi:hypothetical protein
MPTAQEILPRGARQRVPRGMMAEVIEELWREQPAPMARSVRILEDRSSGSVRRRRVPHRRSLFFDSRARESQGDPVVVDPGRALAAAAGGP